MIHKEAQLRHAQQNHELIAVLYLHHLYLLIRWQFRLGSLWSYMFYISIVWLSGHTAEINFTV